LEQLLENYPSPRVLKRLKAVFSHPLHLHKPFHMRVIASDNEVFEIRGMGNECHLLGQFYAEEITSTGPWRCPDGPAHECRELSFPKPRNAEPPEWGRTSFDVPAWKDHPSSNGGNSGDQLTDRNGLPPITPFSFTDLLHA
jgi:hypothetical protein